MMHMTYWFGTSIGDLLFNGYTITSVSGFLSTCIGLASLAILFEAIRVQHASVKHKSETTSINIQTGGCPSELSALLIRSNTPTGSRKLLFHLNQLFWYLTQVILGYVLMLCVMTYNGYFTISVALGAGVGYFIFGQELTEIRLMNSGLGRAKVECPVCKEKVLTEENDARRSSIVSEVAQGLVEEDLPLSNNGLAETLVEEDAFLSSVAVFHKGDNEEVQ